MLQDCNFFGPLILQEKCKMYEEKLFKDICISPACPDISEEVYEVKFKYESLINIESTRLFNVDHNRWKVTQLDEDIDTLNFFSTLFNEGFNPSGQTKKALFFEVCPVNRTEDHPIKKPLPLIVYGDNKESEIQIYAHFMLHDFDHFTAYEMARFDDYPNRDKEEDALFDILGPDNCIRIPKYMASSAEILPPYNKIKDIDLFESIGEGSVGQKRDLISEAKNASKRRKTMSRQNSTRLQFPSLFPTEPSQMTTTDSKINPSQVTDESHRSIKSLPSKQRSSSKVHPSSSQDSCPTSLLSSKYIPPHEAKHPSPSSATVAEVSSIEPLLSSVNEPEEKNNCLPITREIYNERKNLIIKMIKEEMIKQGKVIIKENEPFFQQVYVSMRYNYMKVMNADKDMDLKWLQIVIKMHIDFFLQMEKIVDALL